MQKPIQNKQYIVLTILRVAIFTLFFYLWVKLNYDLGHNILAYFRHHFSERIDVHYFFLFRYNSFIFIFCNYSQELFPYSNSHKISQQAQTKNTFFIPLNKLCTKNICVYIYTMYIEHRSKENTSWFGSNFTNCVGTLSTQN